MRRVLDWLFRNRRTGQYTVSQWPNVALGTFIVARLLYVFVDWSALRWISVAALALWAIDEIVRGVNPFRRILGAVVLVGLFL